MTIYPVEFHRRLEQKWASRIDQTLTVTGKASPPRDPNDDEDEATEDEEDEHLPGDPAAARQPDKHQGGLGYRCDVAQLVMTRWRNEERSSSSVPLTRAGLFFLRSEPICRRS